ncbi:MAG: hypothetical protein WBB45_14260 [Cyclobacteriaceae bacterium]
MKYLSIILLIFIAACSSDQEKRVSRENIRFTTSDASELFFKNVRQTSYDKQGLPGSDIQIFRLSDRNMNPDHPVVNLAIALNWMYDQAYLVVETNEYLDDEENVIVNWKDPDTDSTGTYVFEGGSKEDNFRWAVDIYTSIQDDHDLYIMVNDKEEPLMDDKAEREAYRRTMLDYLRLVDLIR